MKMFTCYRMRKFMCLPELRPFLSRNMRNLSITAVVLHPPRGVAGLRRSRSPEVLKIQDICPDKEETKELHIPVMRREVLEILSPEDNQVFVDMTFGAGGHTRALLDRSVSLQVYALDRDPVAHSLAQNMAKKYEERLHPLLGRFSELEGLLQSEGLGTDSVDGILIDCGCSSMQFDSPERGFGISKNEPLDMRMDGDRFPSQPTAADVVNTLDMMNLAKIFKTYGEETSAKKIATAIVEYRERYQPILTTLELATVISCAFTHTDSRRNKDMLGRKAHVATKTFQGLRIFVNNELNELSAGLVTAGKLLRPGGKLAVLSFHSLEDRIVKRFFQGREVNERGKNIHERQREPKDLLSFNSESQEEHRFWDPVNKNKVILPGDEEIEQNPRSRSAKLRVAVKLSSKTENDFACRNAVKYHK